MPTGTERTYPTNEDYLAGYIDALREVVNGDIINPEAHLLAMTSAAEWPHPDNCDHDRIADDGLCQVCRENACDNCGSWGSVSFEWEALSAASGTGPVRVSRTCKGCDKRITFDHDPEL